MLVLLWMESCVCQCLKSRENSTGALGKFVVITRFFDKTNLTILFLLCPTLLTAYCLMGLVTSVPSSGTEHI